MKFEISTKALQKALSVVSHATAWITTTPILENILIKVQYKSIILTANNLEMAIEYMLDDASISSEWTYSVPSKLFSSYIALLSDDTVSIELVSGWSLEIKTSSGKTKIKGIAAEEFPVIPNIKEELSLSLKGSVVKGSIEKTLFSSAEWNIRPTLAGLFVQISWSDAIFASTDSFRLSEYKTILETQKWDVKFAQIIPSKTCYEIKSILGDDEDVTIVSGENQIAFFFGNVKLYSRLLNGKFPDYKNFFPNSYTTKWVINRYDLMQALKKINLISRENNYSIKMSFSAENGILLETSETQIWEGEVQLVWSVEGEDSIIWINSTYFLEALWVIDTTHVSLQFENPLAPILLLPVPDEWAKKALPGQFKHIIMPLKI